MKKIILSIFALPLIALCCSMSVNAQSSETDLNQVELMKQYIGTWKAEIVADTTAIVEIIPSEKGYVINVYYQAKGVTYNTGKGIIGFAKNNTLVNWYTLWSGGGVSRDFGKFVSEDKITWERYNADHNHVTGIIEGSFKSADKLIHIWKWRGMKDTWDDVPVYEFTLIRVKK